MQSFSPVPVLQSAQWFSYTFAIYLFLKFFYNCIVSKFKTCQELELDSLKSQIRQRHIPRLWKIPFPFLSKRIWPHVIQIHQKEAKVPRCFLKAPTLDCASKPCPPAGIVNLLRCWWAHSIFRNVLLEWGQKIWGASTPFPLGLIGMLIRPMCTHPPHFKRTS